MTAPRIPLMQRKGAPAPIPDETSPPIANGDAPVAEAVPATCPNCGCTFDVASGEVMESEAPSMEMGEGAGVL